MNAAQFASAIGCTPERAEVWFGSFSAAMALHAIYSRERMAAFLAQVGHESGGLVWVKEIWGPTPQQLRYEPPGDLARKLGNTQPGDGKRFMGRGPIQITGRANYIECGNALGVSLILEPELLMTPSIGALSACWFFVSRGCLPLADVGNFDAITRKINGGMTCSEDRRKRYLNALEVLSWTL